MADEKPNGGAPAQPGAPTGGSDQASKGAADKAVDLEAAVADLARKEERNAQKRVSLDLIDNPEHRKIAERLQSQAVTEYRKKLEQGTDEEFVSKAQVETMLRNERKAMKAEQEATERHREILVELEIRKGTEDYDKFAAAAVRYLDKGSLGNKEALETLARGLGVGKFKAKEVIPPGGRPFLPPGGRSISQRVDGKPTAPSEIEEVMGIYDRLGKRR